MRESSTTSRHTSDASSGCSTPVTRCSLITGSRPGTGPWPSPLEELWSEQRTELPFDAATVDEALAALRSRFGNARIEHRLAQIATDGSQKLGPRIIDPLRSRLSAGRDPGRAQLGVLAAWADHLAGPDVRDAGAGALVERLRDATAPRERAAAVLRALAPDLTDLTDPLAERIAARQQGALA